uniref:Coatomer subunit epsilon n=1 Tax=Albugo laibachii Nc14 TaxID=890382 RepID=F0WET5_9STRA|nr:coatomer subunit epsilon putative [Albugo laibachii Nc14]|eukprot:CCA19717.1 coatomer subunit epsilon putative [Albugo laibachii Nc14]
MAEPDELFTLKNQFWVGNYRNAISEASMLTHLDGAMKIERDVYVYRAYLGLSEYDHVLESISDNPNTPIALSAVKLLAMYCTGGDKEIVILTLKEWLSEGNSSENPYLLLIAGIIYMQEGKLSDALSALHRGNSLEHMLCVFQLYARVNRLDLALKTVQDMKQIEEDSTCTQLAQAWYWVLKGGESADEAALLFQELTDRFGKTCLLLNGGAVAFMALRNYVEAERLLLEAYSKESHNQDTLTNLIVVSTHLKKSHTQYIGELQKVAPINAWLSNLSRMEQEYLTAASSFA